MLDTCDCTVVTTDACVQLESNEGYVPRREWQYSPVNVPCSCFWCVVLLVMLCFSHPTLPSSTDLPCLWNCCLAKTFVCVVCVNPQRKQEMMGLSSGLVHCGATHQLEQYICMVAICMCATYTCTCCLQGGRINGCNVNQVTVILNTMLL